MLGQFDRKFYIDFLRDIDGAEMSGILRLRQNRTIKALFFESGCLVFGISNLPDEELGQYLVNVGYVTPENLDSLRQHVNRAQPITFLLQAYNLVNYEQLIQSEHELVAGMAVSCFNWQSGEYTFDSSKTADHEFKTQIRALDILAEGIRNLDDSHISAAIGDLEHYVLPVADVFNRTKRINLNAQEGYILSQIDKPKTISKLISGSGLPEADVLRYLYVLLATGVLDPLEEVIDIKTSVRLANTMAGTGVRPVPINAPTASSPRASGAYRKLSPLDQTYSTLQAAQAQQTYQAQSVVQAQPIAAAQPVQPQAKAPEAKPRSNKIDTAKLEALAGIKIRSSTGVKETAEGNEQAEQLFIQGKQLLRTGDIRRAENIFRQAIDLSPDTAKYLLALALLLAKRAGTHKEAEGLLIRCCELEPTAIEPRLQLAGIYEYNGVSSKAEQMYKSILNIEPNHPVATEKLKKSSSIVGSLFSKILKK
jgi:tetratricopeptide (TPR) repeat protein